MKREDESAGREFREWATLTVLAATCLAAVWYACIARKQLAEYRRANDIAAKANAETQKLAEAYMALSKQTLDKVTEGVNLNRTTQRARLAIQHTRLNGPGVTPSAEVVIENVGSGTVQNFRGVFVCAELQEKPSFPLTCRDRKDGHFGFGSGFPGQGPAPSKLKPGDVVTAGVDVIAPYTGGPRTADEANRKAMIEGKLHLSIEGEYTYEDGVGGRWKQAFHYTTESSNGWAQLVPVPKDQPEVSLP